MLARQDCEKMREKVVEIGMGVIFNAAILTLQREDSDWKAEGLGINTERNKRCFLSKNLLNSCQAYYEKELLMLEASAEQFMFGCWSMFVTKQIYYVYIHLSFFLYVASFCTVRFIPFGKLGY